VGNAADPPRQEHSGAPPNCSRTRQAASTLRWLRAFLLRRCGTLTKVYPLDAHLNRGTRVRIVENASSRGMGPYLIVKGAIAAWYAAPIDPWVAKFFGLWVGSHLEKQA
jgi:hypothetical protein